MRPKAAEAINPAARKFLSGNSIVRIANIEAFDNFEAALDSLAASLAVCSMPVRIPYAFLFNLVDSANAKERLPGSVSCPEAASDVLSRASYLMEIFKSCPHEPLGGNAFEVVQTTANGAIRSNMRMLISYSHFCEIAPYVRRGNFRVTGNEHEIILAHKSKSSESNETRDIILNQISLPLSISHPERHKRFFDQQVNTLPKVNYQGMTQILAEYTAWFSEYSLECSILSDEAIQQAIGINQHQFRKCRATWLSLAEFWFQMAEAVRRRLFSDPKSHDRLGVEYWEWTTAMINSSFLEECTRKVAGIDSKQFASLMAVYSFNPSNPKNGGEGFLPPFCRISNEILFSPHAVRHMLSSRNILYAILKTDQQRFDNFISPHLEPHLIEVARGFFVKLKDVKIILNHEWDSGECDMLIYRENENCVLHVQAKAAIPPEGARMTARVESRVKEALNQLSRFRELPSSKQDEILSQAFERKIDAIKVVDVILCWSSFGTDNIWKQLIGIAPINIALLANMVERDSSLPLHSFVEIAHKTLDEIVAAASPSWVEGTLDFYDRRLTLPNLEFDRSGLARYQLAVHRCLIKSS